MAKKYHKYYCEECKKEIGNIELDGIYKGHRIHFCSFKCHDSYIDKEKENGKEIQPKSS